MFLPWFLRAFVEIGTLNLIDSKGVFHRFEGEPGPEVTVRIHDPWVAWKLPFNPSLVVGEAFMNGTFTVENGDVYDFLDWAVRNRHRLAAHGPFRMAARIGRAFRWLAQYNPVGRARRNVAHHYDLSDRLYELFLDADRQYSCAYFPTADEDLDTAQALKKRHIAAKLLLAPGQTVLDIGSGWGGLDLYLADVAGCRVTGVTLSTEQLKVSQARAKAAGLEPKVEFRLQDYRQVSGRFDRIVSVGMLEHVGAPHLHRFFATVAKLLEDDGVALIHTIARADGPGATDPWIRKYIFPGGYCPALSEVAEAIEASGLVMTDIETLGLHYADTLKAWRARFNANRDEIREIYDERFCRMWDFYLAACEATFRHGDQLVYQIQLAKHKQAVPRTRDYIYEWEHAQAIPRSDAA